MANPVNPRPSKRTLASLTFSTAADGLSDTVDITGYFLAGITMSTGWTDAAIGFKVCAEGSTNFIDLYTSTGDLSTIVTTANRAVVIPATNFLGFSRLQLVSETTAGVAVPQAASRSVQLALYTYVSGGN